MKNKKGEEMSLKFILLTKEIKLSPQTDNLPLLYKADKIFWSWLKNAYKWDFQAK